MVVHLEISQHQPSSFRRLFVQAERLLKSQHARVKLAGRIKIVSSKSDMSHTNNLGTSGRSRRRAARARLRHARRDQHRKQQHLQYFHGERWWTSKRPTVKLRREGNSPVFGKIPYVSQKTRNIGHWRRCYFTRCHLEEAESPACEVVEWRFSAAARALAPEVSKPNTWLFIGSRFVPGALSVTRFKSTKSCQAPQSASFPATPRI